MFNLFSNIKNMLNQTDSEIVLNKHIRFDEDADNESDLNQQMNKTDHKCETFNLNLVKIRSRRESSFGFEVKGDSTKPGEHYIDTVQDDSPAGRVGLQKFDKILKVNGVDVSSLSAKNLIDLLEYETELNENKLNLVISRLVSIGDSNDSVSSKRSLESKESRNEKKKRVDEDTDFRPAVEIETCYLSDTERTYDHIRALQIEQIKFVSPCRPLKKHHVPSKNLLNQKAREIQIRLSGLGKYVNWAEVVYELLESYQCDHIGDLGLNQADNLEVINELIRVQKRIDNIIISSEIKVPFVTFLDLEQFIVTDYNHNAHKFGLTKIRDFEDLHVGPLIKNQIARRVFQIPDHVTHKDQLKMITGAELLKYLVSYLRDNDLWSVKVKQPEFEEFLIKKTKSVILQTLGIKIINLGIIIGALKTVQHLYSENLKTIKLELETDIKEFYKNEKTYLMKKLDGFTSKYLQADSVDLICDLLGLFEHLLDRNDYYYINDFLTTIKDSSYLRDCFQLAICFGKHELYTHLDVIESNMDSDKFYHKYKHLLKRLFCIIVDKNTQSKRELAKMFSKFFRDKGLKIVDSGHKKFEDDSESEDEKVGQVQENLDKKLEDFLTEKFEPNSIITFDLLKRIEYHIFNDRQKYFCDLIENNRAIFDRLNLSLEFIKSKTETRFKRNEILSFINQVKQGLGVDTVEDLVLRRFGVQSLDELKLGSLESLVKDSEGFESNGVICIESVLEPVRVEKIEIEELVSKINECPVLGDLYDYLAWADQARFYGDFKNFVGNLNKKGFEVSILDLQGNRFLKLFSNSSIEDLKASIECKDPLRTAGHLISLLCVRYKSILKCPKNLILNEIQSAMSSLTEFELYKFIIELIIEIPHVFVPHVIFKFILEPVIGINSDHEVTTKIFDFLKENFSDEKLKYFVKLGQVLSIENWSVNDQKPAKKEVKELQVKVRPVVYEPKIEMEVIEIPETVPEPTEAFTNEHDHIMSIRKRYGIGLELNPETKNVTDSLTGVIGRSLQSLSNELYNKDMHFVLELIQNADDNTYESTNPATLVFSIDNGSIYLFNNETGFTAKNIEAICDVKASTKGKHQRGYIGRKGIGFKSVFTVTDRPEIHSKNYHIKFDLNNGHIGYILPEWLNNTNDVNLEKEKIESIVGDLGFNTCVKLPLKSESEMQRHKSSLLSNNFNDIKPNLLLFLNRLRKLVILNEKQLIFERVDRDENLVEILSGDETVHKWFMIRKDLKIPLNLKPIDSVESTQLCLAFPLDDLDNLKKLDVFAYLPLRSFGFKFIIQADFVVPASRQDINQDNEWNQWLINQIPRLYVNALKEFRGHKYFANDPILYLNTFLKFLPNETEVLGCFQHVPKQIFDLLKTESFLPVAGGFKKPFECVVTTDYIRDILTHDMLKKYTGKFYLDDRVFVDKKTLSHLGVKFLDASEIIEILEEVFSNPEFEVKQISKWLLILQHCLNGSYSINQEEKFIKKLKQLEIIPVKKFNHEKSEFEIVFVSLENSTVFFEDPHKISLPGLLEKDLLFLNTSEIMCFDSVKNLQIKQFLKNLGVKFMDVYELVNNHIIPELSKPTKPEALYIDYLLFLFKYSSQVSLDFDILSEKLPIKTNKGLVRVKETSVYLTPVYGVGYNFKTSLPSFEWFLVDDVYFERSNDRSKWKKFFLNLGLHEIFVPRGFETNQNGLIVKDFRCDVIDFYTTLAKEGLHEEYQFLNKLIDDNWDSTYSRFKTSSLFMLDKEFNRLKQVQEVYQDSEFYTKLKNSKWILVELKNSHSLMEPSNVFIRDPVFTNLYSDNVPYVNFNKSNFCKDIGIKTEFRLDEFVTEFKKWTSKSFRASFSQMRNIYILFSSCLNSMIQEVDLTELINGKLIFVPENFDENEDSKVSGEFFSTEKLFWSDTTKVFSKHKLDTQPILLENLYSKSNKLKDIFLNEFNIKPSPSFKDYVELLSHIALLSLTNKIPFEEALEDAFKIFKVLTELTTPEDLMEVFKTREVLPCFKNKWVSLSKNPILVDNDFILAESFSTKVPILCTNFKKSNEFADFCDLENQAVIDFYKKNLNCKIFSQVLSLDLENITTSLRENPKVSTTVSRILPYIQSFVYSRQEFKDMEAIEKNLKSLKFFSVHELENVYRLKHDKDLFVSISNKTCFDLKNSQWKFYVRSDCVDNIKDIVKGFIKLFTQGRCNEKLERDMVNFCLLMHQLGDRLSYDDLKEIEKDFGIKLRLPGTCEKWALSQQEIEEGEIGTGTPRGVTNFAGPSARQKMLALDQLSSNQMNLPNEFNVSRQTLEALDKNMDQLEDKMRKNFSIKNLNETERSSKSELSSVDLMVPALNMNKKTREYINKIGRLGELWVNEMLKLKFKIEIERGSIRVEWVNEEHETGLPYDFRIVHFGAAEDGFGDSERFIEVKSTTKMSQEYFPVSFKELLFAQKNSNKFEIYRVYNITSDDPNNVKLKVVRNIPDLLNTHGINLFIVI